MTVLRSFHLGDLLSVTTERLVSPNHIGGVYDVIDFVTGEKHMTHQLPRANGPVKAWLLEKYPWLAEIEAPEFDGEADVWTWLAAQVEQYGEHHLVEQMPVGMYVGREPMAELEEMVGKARIIRVELPRDVD